MPCILNLLKTKSQQKNDKYSDDTKLMACTLLKNRLPSFDSKNFPQEEMNVIKTSYLELLSNIPLIPTNSIKSVFKFFDVLIEKAHLLLVKCSVEEKQNFFKQAFSKQDIESNQLDSLINLGIVAHCISFFSEIMPSHKESMVHVDTFFEKVGSKMLLITNDTTEDVQLFINNFVKHTATLLLKSTSSKNLEKVTHILIAVCYHLIINARLEDHFALIMDNLTEIANSRPRLFKPHVEQILDMIIFVLNINVEPNSPNYHIRSGIVNSNKVCTMGLHGALFVDMHREFMKFKDKIEVVINLVVNCMTISDGKQETDYQVLYP